MAAPILPQNLIAVAERDIGGARAHTVNARDLHAFLEVGKDFSTWIKDRIAQYGFVEAQDFILVQSLRSPESGNAKARPQRTIEYHIGIDMAKELAMVERTPKGKEARLYFIECERRAQAAPPRVAVDVRDPVQLAAVALQLVELNQELQAKLEAAKPAIELQRTLCATDGLHLCEQMAPLLYSSARHPMAAMRQTFRELQWIRRVDRGMGDEPTEHGRRYVRLVGVSTLAGDKPALALTGAGLVHLQALLKTGDFFFGEIAPLRLLPPSRD